MSAGAVLLAALAGSVHCGAMCGAFAAHCGSRPAPGIAYHLGRCIAYVTLGMIAGALGAGIDVLAEHMLGLQRVAAVLMGLTLMFIAVRLGWPRPRTPLVQIGEPRQIGEPTPAGEPIQIVKPAQTGYAAKAPNRLVQLLRRRDAGGAFGVGLLSGLLPCGWLWGFLALAASRGSVLGGAVVMFAFWAGTVPILLAVGGLAGRLTARVRRWARPAVATGMFMAGLLALTGFWLPTLADPSAPAALHCRPLGP